MVFINHSIGDRSARELADLERGLVSREIYINEGIDQQELEQIFARAWLFVGHESQVEKPGDFVMSRMDEEEVILCRDRKNRVHVFLNTTSDSSVSNIRNSMRLCRRTGMRTWPRYPRCGHSTAMKFVDEMIAQMPGELGPMVLAWREQRRNDQKTQFLQTVNALQEAVVSLHPGAEAYIRGDFDFDHART